MRDDDERLDCELLTEKENKNEQAPSGTIFVTTEPEYGKMQMFKCRKCGADHQIFVAGDMVRSVIGVVGEIVHCGPDVKGMAVYEKGRPVL